jgi:hypothetical protein
MTRGIETDRPKQLEGAVIAEDYFKTLEADPAVGWLFNTEDDKRGAGSVCYQPRVRQTDDDPANSIVALNRAIAVGRIHDLVAQLGSAHRWRGRVYRRNPSLDVVFGQLLAPSAESSSSCRPH